MSEHYNVSRAIFRRLLLVFLVANVLAPGVGAATYYVSATGADSNPGSRPGAPWKSLEKVNATTFQPGDRLLFKSGEEWQGALHPKGSGTKERWITLDRYGVGARPLFHGVDQPVIIDLQGQQYWTLQNLATTGGKTGVNIGSNGVNEPAVMHGTHLINLDVSETTGGSEAAMLIRPSTAAMDDVLIEGCSVHNVVAGAAIWVHNTVAQPFDKFEEYCTRVTIRGNRIDGTSDNGIVVSQTVDPLIEGNTVYRCGAYKHSNGAQSAFAGIFPTYCHNAVIRRNEIGYTAGVPAGGDSMAFRCVGCTRRERKRALMKPNSRNPMHAQRFKLLARDLAPNHPRGPHETLGGYVTAARTLDTCSALPTARGANTNSTARTTCSSSPSRELTRVSGGTSPPRRSHPVEQPHARTARG